MSRSYNTLSPFKYEMKVMRNLFRRLFSDRSLTNKLRITSVQTSIVSGRNHFRIAARRRNFGAKWEFEMMAVCDRAVGVWIGRSELRDFSRWATGWTGASTRASFVGR